MNENPTTAPFFERVRIYLSDRCFAKADEYCERILDIEPTNWEAYYLKFIASLGLTSETELTGVTLPFSQVPAYHKLLQYAPEEVKARLAAIDQANYNNLLKAKFEEALALEKKAFTAFQFAKAAIAFEALGSYRNSAELAAACRQKSEQLAANANRKVKRILIVVVIVIAVIYGIIFASYLIYQRSPAATFVYSQTTGGISIDKLKNPDTRNVTIPETINGKPVVEIGSSAFYQCTQLCTVSIPASVTTIGDNAFAYCTSLQEVEFAADSNLTTVGDGAFLSCVVLRSITFPEGVTTIGQSAFSYCRAMEEIVLPAALTSLNTECFFSCDNLTKVTMPNIWKSYNDYNLPPQLETLVLTKGNSTLGSDFNTLQSLTTLVLPEGITEIPDSFFKNNNSLVSVTIPEGVVKIGTSAFQGCTALKSITLPNSLLTIGSYAFMNCKALEEINIPLYVSKIEKSVFQGCGALKSVQLPKNLSYIGSYAFSECTSLTKVVIPKNVSSIKQYAFLGCTALTLYCEAPYTSSPIRMFGSIYWNFLTEGGVTVPTQYNYQE